MLKKMIGILFAFIAGVSTGHFFAAQSGVIDISHLSRSLVHVFRRSLQVTPETRVVDQYCVTDVVAMLGAHKKIDFFKLYDVEHSFLVAALRARVDPQIIKQFLQAGANPELSPILNTIGGMRHILSHVITQSSLTNEYLDLLFDQSIRAVVFPQGFFQALEIVRRLAFAKIHISAKITYVLGLLQLWAKEQNISWEIPAELKKFQPKEALFLLEKSKKRLFRFFNKNTGFGLDAVVLQKRWHGKTVRMHIDELAKYGALFTPLLKRNNEVYPSFLAIAMRSTAKKEVIAYLLQHGAAVNYFDSYIGKAVHVIRDALFYAQNDSLLEYCLCKGLRTRCFPKGVAEAATLLEEYRQVQYASVPVKMRIEKFARLIAQWANEKPMQQNQQMKLLPVDTSSRASSCASYFAKTISDGEADSDIEMLVDEVIVNDTSDDITWHFAEEDMDDDQKMPHVGAYSSGDTPVVSEKTPLFEQYVLSDDTCGYEPFEFVQEAPKDTIDDTFFTSKKYISKNDEDAINGDLESDPNFWEPAF